MGFKNSPAYVQHSIDSITRSKRDFARAYINNIVIFCLIFENHLHHLQQLLQRFKENLIVQSSKKCFLARPSIALLGQKVEDLGLVSATDKLAAIEALKFSQKPE